MPETHDDMATPTYRLLRGGMWIVGGIVFAGMLLWAASSGFTLSDTAWKSITSIALAIIAAGVPVILSKLDRVEKHTNSIVSKLVDQAEVKGEETGRVREVRRAEREDKADTKEDNKENNPPIVTLEDLDGKEVVIEGTMTEKDEDKAKDADTP